MARKHSFRFGLPIGEFMTVGMEPKRAAWLNRVLDRLGANDVARVV
jgi:hypothetical protein